MNEENLKLSKEYDYLLETRYQLPTNLTQLNDLKLQEIEMQLFKDIQ